MFLRQHQLLLGQILSLFSNTPKWPPVLKDLERGDGPAAMKQQMKESEASTLGRGIEVDLAPLRLMAMRGSVAVTAADEVMMRMMTGATAEGDIIGGIVPQAIETMTERILGDTRKEAIETVRHPEIVLADIKGRDRRMAGSASRPDPQSLLQENREHLCRLRMNPIKRKSDREMGNLRLKSRNQISNRQASWLRKRTPLLALLPSSSITSPPKLASHPHGKPGVFTCSRAKTWWTRSIYTTGALG